MVLLWFLKSFIGYNCIELMKIFVHLFLLSTMAKMKMKGRGVIDHSFILKKNCKWVGVGILLCLGIKINSGTEFGWGDWLKMTISLPISGKIPVRYSSIFFLTFCAEMRTIRGRDRWYL